MGAKMVAAAGAALILASGVAWAQDAAAPAPSVPAPEAAAAVAEPAQSLPAPDAATVAAASPEAAAPEVSPAMAAIRQNGCLAGASRATPEQISAFLAQPATLLSNYGMTSLELSGRVRALVGSDTRTLNGAIELVGGAAVDQRAAIGAGLGRAAFACQEVNPEYAAEIQSRVADLQFGDVKTAFLAATNDIQVAAIAGAASGGGAAAGAPGLSGGGEAGPGTAGAGGDDTVATTSGTFTVGSGGGVSYLEGSGGGLFLSISSVSPFSVD